jgi:hypothetical protein
MFFFSLIEKIKFLLTYIKEASKYNLNHQSDDISLQYFDDVKMFAV